MPQIPMPEKAGMIRHQPDAVPMTGAPGMDFNMQANRELVHLGDRIGQSGLHFSDAMLRFARETAAAEDRLAEREYMTAWAEHEGELEKRMAAEPGRVEEFGAWAAESDKAWAEKAKPFLDRMTDRHRAEFAARMQAARIQSRDRRMRISFAASATRQAQAFRDNFELNCNRGDWDGASAALDAAHGVLAPAEIEKLRNSLPARREEWEYRRRIERGEYDKVIEAMRSGDYQGHLSADNRHALEREAVQRRYEAERQQDDAFLAHLASGQDVPTQEFLREQHEAGVLSDRQFAKWSGWLKSYEAGERAEERQAKAEHAAEARARHAAAEEKVAQVFWDEMVARAPSDKAKVYDKILKACGGDVQRAIKWRKKFLEFDKENTSKDNIWTRVEGQVLKKRIKDMYDADKLYTVAEPGFFWNTYDKRPEFQARQYVELLEYAKARLLANSFDVEKTWIDCREQVEKLQQGKIRTILEGTVRDTLKKGGKNGR